MVQSDQPQAQYVNVVVCRYVIQEVVYDDPRFEDGQKKERAKAKLQCLEDIRCG